MSGSDPQLTRAVLEAIAAHRGVDVSDLEFVLHDVVDTGALNALGRHDGTGWQLTIQVDGHTVTVDDDGFVLVDGGVP
jgi:hypothetical protein